MAWYGITRKCFYLVEQDGRLQHLVLIAQRAKESAVEINRLLGLRP